MRRDIKMQNLSGGFRGGRIQTAFDVATKTGLSQNDSTICMIKVAKENNVAKKRMKWM